MTDSLVHPYSIRIFLPTGEPDGLRLITKSNWTGVGVVFRRTNYKEAVKRPEFENTGVYVLVGSAEGSALPLVYIGEGDPVKNRLNDHYGRKDFWDWGIFFVTKDGSLNKAHVKHLESRLLELAAKAKQCKIDNTLPSLRPSLTEPETADVENFLQDMLSIFPLVGLSIFEEAQSPRSLERELLYIESKGISARAYEDAKGFVVLQGSGMVLNEVPSIHQYMTTLRSDLIEQEIVVSEGDRYVFAQDYVFSSPSTAAGVVLGRTANGRLDWKLADGRTLKALQDELADSIDTGDIET